MNNITYNGVVSLNVGNSTSSFKNKGTKELGTLITRALAGYDILDDIPKYFAIECYDGRSDGIERWSNLLNRHLPLTGITYSTDDTEANCIGKLNFSCAIISSDKLQTSVSENNQLRLCLYSKSKKLLAIVNNKTLFNLYNNIVEGTDCLVNWQMSFYCETDKVILEGGEIA